MSCWKCDGPDITLLTLKVVQHWHEGSDGERFGPPATEYVMCYRDEDQGAVGVHLAQLAQAINTTNGYITRERPEATDGSP